MDASVVFSGETADKRSGPADHMSVSVVAEDKTAHTLSGETADVKSSGPESHMSVSVGEADDETAHKLSSPPEHPRVTRLRHRRLMAFLLDQGFHDSYNGLMNKTRAYMSLDHLRGLVERGLWGDAVKYLDRYLSPAPRSLHGEVLRRFLVIHHFFANAVAGMGDKNLPRHYLQVNNDRAVSHADFRLRSISLHILAVDHVRANMNWQRVRDRASIVVARLAHSAPELRCLVELPATSIKPHHVLPIASGLWSRRRYVKKKQTGRTEAIIRALKSQRLTGPEIGSVEEAKELLADLLDETVRNGVHVTMDDLSRPLQPGGNEGAQFCKPLFDTSTEAKTSEILANAGAQFCQPMFVTSTETKTSGTLANAGTYQHVVEAGCDTNTARQDLDGRKNSREESTIVKLERELKRQRLTGSFCEASRVVRRPGAVVNLGGKLSGVSSG
uniref:Uncharacterized protein n=1 Tax=Avena sativa TaxID=4498 RepID=A0ACD5UCC6_AVESA